MGLFEHNKGQKDGSKYSGSMRNDPIGHVIREATGIGSNYKSPTDTKSKSDYDKGHKNGRGF